MGGRLTTGGQSILSGPFALIPPADPSLSWRYLQLDAQTFDTIDAPQLAEYLADLSPEVSRALWDFLRMANPGWRAEALRPGTDEADPAAQLALDAFIGTLDELYGAIDVTIGRLFLGMFLRGAFLAELVLDAAGRLPVDLVTPDPWCVRFRWREDAVRGRVQQLCQWQGGRLVDLDRATIRYVPVDPMPGSPYGRPLVAPSLFVALFLLVTLHDLRRVIQQQGYPRLDVEIVSEEVRAQMPVDIREDPVAVQTWLTDVWTQITAAIRALEPDDTYVHDSKVKMNRPIGTVDSSSLGGVQAVIEGLERMCVRALKTMPFLMSLSQASSEATSNREWEAHLQGVKAIQHYAETPLSRLFTLALQAQGIVATVRVRFAENRASERQRDALSEQTEIANARAKYDAGWTSQDEASQEITGRAADVPEPRAPAAGAGTTQPATTNPDPGSARSQPAQQRDRRAKLVPLGHDQPFDSLPDVTITDDDMDRAVDVWNERMPPRVNGLLAATVVNGEAE